MQSIFWQMLLEHSFGEIIISVPKVQQTTSNYGLYKYLAYIHYRVTCLYLLVKPKVPNPENSGFAEHVLYIHILPLMQT